MVRMGSIIAGGTSLALSAFPALAQQGGTGTPPPNYYYGPMHMGWGWGGGWHPGFFFGPLLWIVVIFALVALFARFRLWGHHGYHRRPGSALDILNICGRVAGGPKSRRHRLGSPGRVA